MLELGLILLGLELLAVVLEPFGRPGVLFVLRQLRGLLVLAGHRDRLLEQLDRLPVRLVLDLLRLVLPGVARLEACLLLLFQPCQRNLRSLCE